ncbi:MAG: hypothetical protein H6R17_1799 [Proteobacteria bacterium]|nr:hypothetical protein [Pseudomonadota bacterium]
MLGRESHQQGWSRAMLELNIRSRLHPQRVGRPGVERQAKAAVSQALQVREPKPDRALKLVKEQKLERKQEPRRSRARKVG